MTKRFLLALILLALNGCASLLAQLEADEYMRTVDKIHKTGKIN